jgi:hypothetical protein
MKPSTPNSVNATARGRGLSAGLIFSIVLHVAVIGGLTFWFHEGGGVQIVAAGPGEGGEGGGGSIQVGVADPSAILGFAKPKPVSYVGETDSPINNARVETVKPQPEQPDEVLTPTPKEKPRPDTVKTDRPVANQEEKAFTGKEERGRSASTTALTGRTFGSPTPAVVGGIGIGSGGGLGIGTGLPGGSEYGRRIQSILGRNYNPPVQDAGATQFVVIILRISRGGAILSLSGGRVSAGYFKQRSQVALVNNAAERAVIASNPLPPFPPGFLPGVNEAVAEAWFRYPK